MSYDYELLVIGSGPAGQKAAIQGAKLGRKVAIVERRELGGVSVNWGTIPSKTLREAIVYLTGMTERETYGASYRVKEEITIEDLRLRTQRVIDGEVDVVRHQLMRNHVQVVERQRPLRRPAHDRRRRADADGREDRPRPRDASRAPVRRSSSTTARSSTPTASCSSIAFPPRASSSAPA